MPTEAHFTQIFVSVPRDHMQPLWLHVGTVRYGFAWSWFFKGLRPQFVPVRFPRRRYGTVHPSIKGCTRTTPASPDRYRRAQPRLRPLAEIRSWLGRAAVPTTRSVPNRWAVRHANGC
jgi:hypothetical protein